MYPTLALLVTLAAAAGGFLLARSFVRTRLRFVDAAQSRWAPLVAGIGALALASPLVVLPLVSKMTVVVFAVAVALGTASGGRALRRLEAASRRLLH